jgi:predicted short-subunit dehydrogenase-like oxidoreductase (DUF2520 family)
VDNWVSLGAEKGLTGPVARGDEAIVARQREAVVERAPELAPLFDALLDATRRVATDQPLGDEAPSSPPMALATHGVRA